MASTKFLSNLVIDGSGGTVLDVQGSVGQLFSVTDSLTGDLFAVSDISGIPILNVNSSGAVDIDGTLSLGDSNKIQLGASQDLQIFHNGNDSYIQDSGTGDLRIISSATKIYDADSSHFQATFTDGGSVDLYYGGNKKFETTSAGISVTGNGAFSGSVTATGTVQGSYVTANNTAGAGDGSAQEVARFVNTRSGATSSYMYIGAASGTDWRLGKNINGTSLNTNFGITKHSGTDIFLEIDGTGNTSILGSISASNFSGSSSGTNTGDQDLSSYLTTVSFSDLTGKPTTLSGYGIIDGASLGLDQVFTGDTEFEADLLRTNQRISNNQEYPLGHYTPGETVFELDPTWSNRELRQYFGNDGVSWDEVANAPGGYAVYINGSVSVGGAYNSGFPYIPIDQDGIYYMEVWIKNAGTAQGHYMGSIDYEADFTAPASGAGNPGSYGYWVMSNYTGAAEWTKRSGYITGHHNSNTGAFETDATYWTPQALFNYSAGTGTRACWISGWKVIRVDHVGDRTFQDDVKVKGKLEVHTLDSNTSSTTALVMNANEVEKRTLGSNAFNSTSFLTSINNGNWSGTDLSVANGGTGSSTASGARTNLGLGTAATAASTDFISATNADTAAELITFSKGVSTDGHSKFYNWRALNNSSNSGNFYWKIAEISGADQSSRFIVTLAGRSTSYADNALPAMGHIVGQLNNDNNWDLVFYNHSTASSEVVTEVAIVDDGVLGVELWIKTGNYAEITASGHISDGSFTVVSNASSDGFTESPDGYTVVTEYTAYNSGNTTLGTAAAAATTDFATASHTHSAATTSASGFMSSSDKTKLDGVATGADVTPSWVPSTDPNYLTSETFGSSDVVLSLSGTDVTAGESITLAGGLSYSGTTLTSANDNTTYTAGAGLTLTDTTFSVTANTYATAAQGTKADNAAPKDYESIANLGSPDAISGTWVNAGTTDWGTPRIGSSTAKYTDGTGYIQFNIPDGMKTAYLSQLTWSSGGYFYIYGIQSDGGAVLLRVVNSKNSVENANEGNPNQHDGSTTVFAGTGLDNYSAIRIQNKSGRLHLTGLGFTSSAVQGSEGMGLVHPSQLSTALSYNSLINLPTLGTAAAAATTDFAAASHTHSAATTSAAGFMSTTDKTKLDGIETSADVTDTANVVAALTAGTNVQISDNGTISATDTDTVYTHPTTAGNKHIPTGGSAGQFLKYSSSGTAVWATPSYTTNTDTQLSDSYVRGLFTGGTNVSITAAGVISSTDTTYSTADFDAAGSADAVQSNLDTVAGNVAGISNQSNTDVDTGTETIAQVSKGTYTAAFFDFVIKNGTNVRAGTVYSCHDGTNVEFTETSTVDLGDTSDVSLSVDISGTNMRLRATTTSNNWSVKSLVRAI